MTDSFIRCRHCGAVALAQADRCPLCHGRDPFGQRFALLGSAFFGVLLGALAAGTLVAVLWHRWERWVGMFGDATDDAVRSFAGTAAVAVIGLVFAVATLLAGALVLRSVRFR